MTAVELPLTTRAETRVDSRLVATLVLLSAALASAAMLWSRRAYVPMWDGRIYADCVIAASQNLLDVGGYRCAEHISQSYVAILAIAERFAVGSLIPILVMNALLLAAGAVALMRVLHVLFPDEEHRVGCALVTAAFLVHPVVLASVVQPGLDFGLLIFGVCALASMIEGRRWPMVLFGVLLVFCKETGVLVYGVLVAVALWRDALRRVIPNGAYWFGVTATSIIALLNFLNSDIKSTVLPVILLGVLLLRRRRPARVPVVAIVRATLSQWTLAIPLVIVVGYMATNAIRGALAPAGATVPPVLWSNAGPAKLLATLVRPGIIDPSTVNAFALMFIVSFMWIPAGLALVDAVAGIVRRALARAPRNVSGANTEELGLIAAVLVGYVWLLSRFITFANARYFLPIYPLILIFGYGALVRLNVKRGIRYAVLAVTVLLFGVSAVRTVDPISINIWDTFTPGDKPILFTTSLTGECCGAGRDQLVYNLQFTNFGDLLSDATEVIRPDDASTIIVAGLGNWFTVGVLDSTTRRRTLATTGIVTPTISNAGWAARPEGHVKDAWFFELPYVDNERPLAVLNYAYLIGPPAIVTHNGYAMGVRRLRLRAPALESPASTKTKTAPSAGAPQ